MMNKENLAGCLFVRVSTHGQDTDSSLTELREWFARRGIPIVCEIPVEDSAYQTGRGGKGKIFEARRRELYEGARLKKWNVAGVWAVDRLSRRGPRDYLAFVDMMTEVGCDMLSLNDSWLENVDQPMVRELIGSMHASLAHEESRIKSNRAKMGAAKRRRNGLPGGVGRKKGARDRTPRVRNKGDAAGWTAERRAAASARMRERNPMVKELARDA